MTATSPDAKDIALHHHAPMIFVNDNRKKKKKKTPNNITFHHIWMPIFLVVNVNVCELHATRLYIY